MVYGVLGAAFMPFLGVTLLLLLDSRRITEGRSGWLSNLMLTAVSALFVVLLATRSPTASPDRRNVIGIGTYWLGSR